MKACVTCGAETRRIVRTECKTCFEYRRRTGRPRPEWIIIRRGQRLLENQLAYWR